MRRAGSTENRGQGSPEQLGEPCGWAVSRPWPVPWQDLSQALIPGTPRKHRGTALPLCSGAPEKTERMFYHTVHTGRCYPELR